MVLRCLFLRIKVKVTVFLMLWVSLTACNICQPAISQNIAHLRHIDLYGNLVLAIRLTEATTEMAFHKSMYIKATYLPSCNNCLTVPQVLLSGGLSSAFPFPLSIAWVLLSSVSS